LPRKLAPSLKFSYNTAISFSGDSSVFEKYFKKQTVGNSPEKHTCIGVA
jgi:hypothetical protein